MMVMGMDGKDYVCCVCGGDVITEEEFTVLESTGMCQSCVDYCKELNTSNVGAEFMEKIQIPPRDVAVILYISLQNNPSENDLLVLDKMRARYGVIINKFRKVGRV